MSDIILQIDTASKTTSLSLVKNGIICEDRIYQNSREQAQFLIPEIQDILQNNRTTIAEINDIRAMIGPGSFTGIRIGLAAAQGLSFGRDCTLSGITNFDAYHTALTQYRPSKNNAPLLIVLESYRKELFFQLRQDHQILATENCTELEIINICAQNDVNLRDLIIIGDGCEKLEHDLVKSNIIQDNILTKNNSIGSQLYHCVNEQIQEMAPYYMRKADAVKSKHIRKITQ